MLKAMLHRITEKLFLAPPLSANSVQTAILPKLRHSSDAIPPMLSLGRSSMPARLPSVSRPISAIPTQIEKEPEFLEDYENLKCNYSGASRGMGGLPCKVRANDLKMSADCFRKVGR